MTLLGPSTNGVFIAGIYCKRHICRCCFVNQFPKFQPKQNKSFSRLQLHLDFLERLDSRSMKKRKPQCVCLYIWNTLKILRYKTRMEHHYCSSVGITSSTTAAAPRVPSPRLPLSPSVLLTEQWRLSQLRSSRISPVFHVTKNMDGRLKSSAVYPSVCLSRPVRCRSQDYRPRRTATLATGEGGKASERQRRCDGGDSNGATVDARRMGKTRLARLPPRWTWRHDTWAIWHNLSCLLYT